MEKIKRYNLVVYDKNVCQFDDEAIAGIDVVDDGDFIRHEDHIAYLKEIFPDWPGEYPTEMGIYFFKTKLGEIQPVYFCKELLDEDDSFYALAILQRMNAREISMPYQWGPRIPVWRKV